MENGEQEIFPDPLSETLVEGGFDKVDWTNEAQASYIEENSSGWQFYLGRLRDYARRANTAASR